MKKFSEFNINAFENKNIFQVPVISIEEVINYEVEILSFEANVKTRHGEGRYIVKIRFEGAEKKFFTNASPIKDALEKIPKSDFPFTTTIRVQRFGSGCGKTYYFT